MELYQIKYLLALSEELNFTRAAECVNITQPTLTRAIIKLEEEFGSPLFIRSKKKTVLSDFGKMMLPFFEKVYESAAEAKKQAESFVQLKAGSLRVGVMCTIAPNQLVGLLYDFRHTVPGVELELVDGSASKIADQLMAGDLDVAIYCRPEDEPEVVHTLPLFRERFVIVVEHGHRFEAESGVKLSDLAGEKYLSRINCEYADQVDRMWEDSGIEVIRAYRSERDDWILCLAQAGVGFAFFPEYSTRGADLVIRPLIEPELYRTVNLVTVRGRRHSPTVGAFVQVANKYRQGLQTDDPDPIP